jgi:hypothetical protein
MTIHRIPNNTYTNSPLQSPNLFLGSLQLLFWLVFRPSAWENHIQHLDPSLKKNFSLFTVFNSQRWQQKKIQQFLFQALIILPILSSLVAGAYPIFILELSASSMLYRMIFGVVFFTVGSSTLGMVFGILGGISGSLTLGITSYTLIAILKIWTFNISTEILKYMMVGISFGISLGLSFGIVSEIKIRTLKRLLFLTVFIVVGIFIANVGYITVYQPSEGGISGVKILELNPRFRPGEVSERFSAFSMTFCLGLLVNWLRPTFMTILLTPWHFILYTIDKNQTNNSFSLLSKHIAFWDEWQYLPIWGLEKHLLLILDKNPIEGQAALNYLSTSRQRWAAQAAQIELDARQLEKCSNAHEIGEIQQILTISELVSPADTIFRSFSSISSDTNAALGQTSTYNQRLALTEVTDKQLNSLVRELTKSSDNYAVRFRPIAQRWQNIIDLHLQDLIRESEERQEISSPYIIGVPVTNRQQLFVGRNDISEKLEKLLLDRRSPPLLLYGQRRTGKTSLLNNLGRLLPTSIIPLFVDLQGSISSAKDHTGFLYNLAKAMINSAQRQRNLKLPPLSYETLATDPFTRFDEWLDNLETALAGNTALLALDEFEVLDRVLNEGRFNENDVLGMLRNLIQHRPKFKVLLAGSHTLDEFQRWSSYLINAQVIHLGYLQEAEARQLIEEPIENFALRYEPSASQRVLDITKGHPFLVQLLCAEIVALKNDQDPSIRRLATLADVEAAIPAALEHGSMFFSDIERNQLNTQSLQVLRYFAQQGEGAIISSADLAAYFAERAEIAEGISGSIELLLRRELIETKPSGYSIQLELIRRWFI